MRPLPLILAAGQICLSLGLASPVFAAVPQTKANPQQAIAPLKPAQMAWVKNLAHPVSRHTLCQPQGRQAFSARHSGCVFAGRRRRRREVGRGKGQGDRRPAHTDTTSFASVQDGGKRAAVRAGR